jgi:two-component system sensor histidine kinase FlrB
MSLASNHFSKSNQVEFDLKDKNTLLANQPSSSNPIRNNKLNGIMSQLNELSDSFLDSYHNLEGQVEKLNDRLLDETEKKHDVEIEKQQLISEKIALSEHLQNLLALMPAGIVVLDGHGRVKNCNLKAENILGKPLLGESWIEIIQRAFSPQADDGHQISLKDGRKIHIETRALENEPGQLLVLTDLTKTRELEAKQSQENKLSSMGKMIASLAHQIRTPLSAAILYGSHLVENKIDDKRRDKFSGLLLERLSFIERQVDDMLNYIKGEAKQKSYLTAKDLFNSLKSMTHELPEFVDFKWTLKKSSKNLFIGDMDALSGAIMNLINNACDAVSSKANPQVLVSFLVDEKLTICISDNGEGIDKERKEHIFEPFYTTKKSGNGLGLAIFYKVIDEHKGKVDVTSEVNKGTQFTIVFNLIGEAEFKLEEQEVIA